jgi:type IV secretion system protein VirB4
LLRSRIEQNLGRLDQRVKTFTRQLNDLMRIEVLDQQGQLRFFRRLLNYDDWRIAGKPQTTQFLDYQVVNSDIEAERDHLRVGNHTVRVLTMKEVIAETRPLVLDQLLKIPANFHGVDPSCDEQGTQGDNETTPAFQCNQDGVHLADGQ